MMDLERAVFLCEGLEYRQRGRKLRGRFPYNSLATVGDRGTVRKERFAPRSLRFSIEDPDRNISLLVGHDFNLALALRSRQFKSLELTDSDAGVDFEATLPPPSQQPTYMKDALLSVDAGLLVGISPGFQ